MNTMPEPPTFYEKYARTICLFCLLSAPIFFYGALAAQRSTTNNVSDWLPTQFEATQRLAWYVGRFGSDEILAISWPGCDLDDERLDKFADRLLQSHPATDGTEQILFRQVLTGRSVLRQLESEPLNLTEKTAMNRMSGWLVNTTDGKTCAIALVRPGADGRRDRHAAVAAAVATAEELGIPYKSLWMAGPTADAVAIDKAGGDTVLFLAMLAAVWSGLLGWLCLRHIRRSTIVFVTAILSWSIALTIVYVSGQNMDAVLLTMPALVFVLAVSGAIHFTHYYSEALCETSPNRAAALAVKNGWKPCLMASLTTACGLSSLALGSVTPVVRFGIFATFGVVAVFVCLMVLWPSLTQLASRADVAQSRRASTSHWWDSLHRISVDFSSYLLISFALASPFLIYGVWKLETSLQLSSLLSPSSHLIQSYAWFDEQIGPVVPVEIVVGFPSLEKMKDRDAALAMLRRAFVVDEIRARVDELPGSGGTMAATTFAPKLPSATGARQVTIRRLAANRMFRNREFYRDLRLVKDHDDRELWRISARVSTGSSEDYGQFLDELDSTVRRSLAESPLSEGSNFKICGAVPLIYMAQEQLLTDLIRSFLAAFILIAIVMAALLGSISGGLLSMIPNLFPALLVFGWMGLRKSAIDIGTMMTASVALGIAVDDTLHFLVWFRRGLDATGDRRKSIKYAFQHCASAMLQTTIICGLGTVPLMFSPFQPIARFAGVLSALLFAALLGDLLLLPAILASPLGKYVVPSPKARESKSTKDNVCVATYD